MDVFHFCHLSRSLLNEWRYDMFNLIHSKQGRLWTLVDLVSKDETVILVNLPSIGDYRVSTPSTLNMGWRVSTPTPASPLVCVSLLF